MKASPRQQQLLLKLQDLDTLSARLTRRRRALPERGVLSSMEADSGAARDAFMTLQREMDTQLVEIERIESDVETVRLRVARDHELLAVSSQAKEAQALQTELETLAHRQNDLEERQLELMEVNEETKARFDEAADVLAGFDERRNAALAAIATAEAQIDAELRETAMEREGLAAEIQRDLLGHYEKLRERSGVGAARLRGKVSEASNMELAPAELASILSSPADELVHCPHSGAILVRVHDE